MTWVKNSLEKLDSELRVKVKKCIIIGCPLLEVNFDQKVHAVLKKVSAITNAGYKSVRYIKVFL